MTPRPLVLAHRGASRDAPENTIEAFARARAQGADGVELDARHTADGVVVVHHDPEVEGVGLLRDADFARLRAARPDIPTLAEALAETAGLVVNVEMKRLPWEPDADPDHRLVDDVVALVAPYRTEVVISSFDLGAVDACLRADPDLVTGWLTHRQDAAVAAAVAVEHGHRWLHPDAASVLPSLPSAIDECHARGLRVDVWTVDEPRDVHALAAAGVDAIITNTPDLALEVLRA